MLRSKGLKVLDRLRCISETESSGVEQLGNGSETRSAFKIFVAMVVAYANLGIGLTLC
jgi:hypothetical protein